MPYRVMKDSFEIRPMYVKRNELTRAHMHLRAVAYGPEAYAD